jgi:hypothetical protein
MRGRLDGWPREELRGRGRERRVGIVAWGRREDGSWTR